jgi:hypothetical protein
MAIRYAVQADSKAECAQGLADLCARLGLVPAMLPAQLGGDRWMARAVPDTTRAPTADADGRGPGVSG